jgi:glucan phosphoethanolaminetransferase (alkaline phosphatase superfamily)
MSHRQILVLVGILIIALPFLGFPMLWKNILFVCIGLSIIYFAFKSSWKNVATDADTYSESHNQTS